LKKDIRELQVEKSQFWGKRNELEQTFLTCVEAVKKEVLKRRPEKVVTTELLNNIEHFT